MMLVSIISYVGFPSGTGPAFNVGKAEVVGRCLKEWYLEFTFSTSIISDFTRMVCFEGVFQNKTRKNIYFVSVSL